jgi:hypothetical protein
MMHLSVAPMRTVHGPIEEVTVERIRALIASMVGEEECLTFQFFF